MEGAAAAPFPSGCCRITAVGDDDQSIYGFQGASIDNFNVFQATFGGIGGWERGARPKQTVRVVRLEQNYRSSGNIVHAANAVVNRNTMRETKKLWTTRGSGSLVAVTACRTAACEAALVVHEILKRHNRTAPAATSASSSLASSSSSGASSGSGAVAFRDMAVLFRTNATGAAFQEALRRHGVPFKTQADQLYNMLEIEDVLAFLRIVTNEADDRAFLRVCKVLQCPIDAAVYGVLQQHQRAQRVSLLHAVRWLQAGGQALLNTVAVNALTAAAAPPHKKPKLGSSSSSSSSSSAKGKAGNGGGGGGSAGAKSALRGLKKVTDAIDTLKNRLEELNLAAFVRRCVDYHPWVKKRMHQLDAERRQKDKNHKVRSEGGWGVSSTSRGGGDRSGGLGGEGGLGGQAAAAAAAKAEAEARGRDARGVR